MANKVNKYQVATVQSLYANVCVENAQNRVKIFARYVLFNWTHED